MPYCPVCGKSTKIINKFSKAACYCKKQVKPRFCKRCGGWLFRNPNRPDVPHCTCHDLSSGTARYEALYRYDDIKKQKYVSIRLSVHLLTYLFTASKVQRQGQYKALRRNLALYYQNHNHSACFYLPKGFHLLRYLKTTKIYPLILKAKITIKHAHNKLAMNLLARLPFEIIDPDRK